MKQYKIVTNGKRFRIQQRKPKENWTFAQQYHSSPDGFGCTTPLEFRSYLRALKRVANYRKWEIERSQTEEWHSVEV